MALGDISAVVCEFKKIKLKQRNRIAYFYW